MVQRAERLSVYVAFFFPDLCEVSFSPILLTFEHATNYCLRSYFWCITITPLQKVERDEIRKRRRKIRFLVKRSMNLNIYII